MAEQILNWFYDRSLDSGLELKATCAPQYYRIARQRRAAARRAGETVADLVPHGGHPGAALHQVTRGCLAGSGVCFVSHRGAVQPCGYLPLEAGNLRTQSFEEIWERSPLFHDLRDMGKLEGKCGCCEFKSVCMGCRARAYGTTGNYLTEEPFCLHEPRTQREASLPVV